MPIDVPSNSRFGISEPILVDGRETFGLTTPFPFLDIDKLPENRIIRFTVTSDFAGRPDLIAKEIYGTAFFDWVIIMSTKPQNPFNFPQTGTVLKLPDVSTVITQI